MKTLYTTGATATGGRNGRVISNDKILDMEVRMPKALGGKDDAYTNPEMLFAAGYAACFDSALNMIIQKAKAPAGETSVTAEVSIGATEGGGFGLSAKIHAHIPGVSMEMAQSLVEKAHQVCPYSNATKGNMEVILSASNE